MTGLNTIHSTHTTLFRHYREVRQRLWRAPPKITPPVVVEPQEDRQAELMQILRRSPLPFFPLRPPRTAVHWRHIVNTVAARFDVDASEVLARQRTTRSTIPRQISYHLIWNITGKSFAAIGRLMDRDHTTVMDGCRQVERRMAGDLNFASLVIDLRKQLEG